MPRDARFWRNVAIITGAHLLILIALARGGRDAARPTFERVVWVNSAAAEAAEPKSTPAPTTGQTEKIDETPVTAVAKSEIQMPSPTPTPTPTVAPRPSPSPTIRTSPKPAEKSTPKPSPKKSAEPKATPRPSPKKEKDDSEKKSATPKKESSVGSNQHSPAPDNPSKGSGNGTAQPSELAWYGTMLHDRFYKAWEQPKSILATGAKMSTIVKIRIEKDGRVSKFLTVKPSGNVVVDESVAAVAQRVTQVDPLPAGLTKNGYYEVKIDFELNAEK
jgi:TonB family protein